MTACRQFGGELVLPLTPAGEETGQSSELNEFLDQAALDSGDYQSDGAAAQMMTLHSAKGLEFPLVFLAGMEEGLFPNRQTEREPGRMEEERRLAYVGITRAMQQLYFTYAETRRLHGSQTNNWPSRFLQEVPANCLQEVRMGGDVSRQFRALHNGADEQDGGGVEGVEGDASVRIGQFVRHDSFGEGVVLQAEGRGDRTRVQVHFAKAGPKWLMLAYANLKAVGA